MTNFEMFIQHLKEQLTLINNVYTYRVEMYSVIKDAKENRLADKELLVIVNPLPSRAYGDNSITQQFELKIICHKDYVDDAFLIFTMYQNSVVFKKYFIENTMINESWLSPSVQDQFVEDGYNRASVIDMSGSVSFTQNIVDVEYIEVCNQKIKVFDYMESFVAEVLSNPTASTHGRKYAVSNGGLLKIDFKCKNANNVLCAKARQIRFGNLPTNETFSVKIIYTDGIEHTYNMMINSQILNVNDGIPTLTLSMLERMS